MKEKLLAHSRTRIVWLFASLLLSVVVVTVHVYALDNFLYWKYRWLDIPMHILGGATIGAFFIGLSTPRRPLLYMGVMIIISVAWEVMEYVSGITRNEPGYSFDTAHDLLDDSVGAILAYLTARLTIWHSV